MPDFCYSVAKIAIKFELYMVLREKNVPFSPLLTFLTFYS